MAEGEGASHAGKGIKGFLMAQTGPLPNWAWLLVVGGGIIAVYFIPKFLGKSGTTAQTASDQSGNQGLGLAIDPTTGLPYAVEGLVPSGGVVGTQPGQLPPPPPTPTTTPTTPTPPKPITHCEAFHGPGCPGWGSSGPLIPFGMYKGPSYSNLQPGTKYTYQGITYLLNAGAGGRLWGTPVGGGNAVLLYGPASEYGSPVTTQPVQNTWNGTTQLRTM